MILFIHETHHTGGGQTCVEAYKFLLTKNRTPFEFFENVSAVQLIRVILRNTYTKVLVHMYSAKYIPVLAVLKCMRIPVVTVVHGVWHLEYASLHPDNSGRKAWFLHMMQGLMFLLSDTAVVFSRYEQSLLKKEFSLLPKKIRIIPAGVNLRAFYPATPLIKKRIRTKLHISNSSRIFLSLSRLDRRKGLDIAIRAFAKITARHPDALLCIVFPTNEFSYQEILTECLETVSRLGVGQHVHFITGVPSSAIPQYFQASDFFLTSSTQLETFGITTIEAAAAGCIPIGFRAGATEELIHAIDAKLIAEESNPEAYAKKMEWLLSLSAQTDDRLRRKAAHMASSYAWENIQNDLSSIL